MRQRLVAALAWDPMLSSMLCLSVFPQNRPVVSYSRRLMKKRYNAPLSLRRGFDGKQVARLLGPAICEARKPKALFVGVGDKKKHLENISVTCIHSFSPSASETGPVKPQVLTWACLHAVMVLIYVSLFCDLIPR